MTFDQIMIPSRQLQERCMLSTLMLQRLPPACQLSSCTDTWMLPACLTLGNFAIHVRRKNAAFPSCLCLNPQLKPGMLGLRPGDLETWRLFSQRLDVVASCVGVWRRFFRAAWWPNRAASCAAARATATAVRASAQKNRMVEECGGRPQARPWPLPMGPRQPGAGALLLDHRAAPRGCKGQPSVGDPWRAHPSKQEHEIRKAVTASAWSTTCSHVRCAQPTEALEVVEVHSLSAPLDVASGAQRGRGDQVTCVPDQETK
jgi:hypothetical protein